METTPTDSIKTYAVGVVMLVAGIAGTATYFDANVAPVETENHVRYEKVDDNTYVAHMVDVRTETRSITELTDLLTVLDNAITTYTDSKAPEDIKRYNYAVSLKSEKLKELEDLKSLGILQK